MTISATTSRVIDKVGETYNEVVARLKLAAEGVIDSKPIDSALSAVTGILGQRYDVDELLTRIDSMEQEIELLRQRDSTISHHMHKLDEEQRLAARIQQDFLPKSLPQVGQFKFNAIYRPAHYVSGDLYDVKRLDEQHVGVYVADAVGHGMPAALLTMFMKNALQTKRILKDGYELVTPSETIAKLNHALRAQDLNHASFATAIYARINCQTQQLCFARGGHPNPLVVHRDGSYDEPTADGSLLGVFDDMEWAEQTIQLQSGDRVFLYTDGVEIAFASQDKPDTEQWKQTILNMRDEPTEKILTTLALAIEDRPNKTIPKDDLTIVVAEVD